MRWRLLAALWTPPWSASRQRASAARRQLPTSGCTCHNRWLGGREGREGPRDKWGIRAGEVRFPACRVGAVHLVLLTLLASSLCSTPRRVWCFQCFQCLLHFSLSSVMWFSLSFPRDVGDVLLRQYLGCNYSELKRRSSQHDIFLSCGLSCPTTAPSVPALLPSLRRTV